MNWINFVGNKYYTEKSFIEEIKKYGFSRAIPLNILEKMQFGDIIRFLMKTSKTRSKYFVAGKITGLNFENQKLADFVQRKLEENGQVVQVVEGGGKRVKRGCGSYGSGSTTYTTAPLSDIVDYIKEFKELNKESLGKIFVAGRLYEIPEKEIYFKDIPHFRGFRCINWDAVEEKIKEQEDKDKIVLSGLFYCEDKEREPEPETEETKFIQEISEYELSKGRKKPKQKKLPIANNRR